MTNQEPTQEQIKPFSFWNTLKWNILPARCILCGRRKLWGKNPHKACADYELNR